MNLLKISTSLNINLSMHNNFLIQHSSQIKFLLSSVLCLVLLTNCGEATKQVVDTPLEVKITNSNFKRITKITEILDIKASGKFRAGTFYFKNTPIVIPKDTSFDLSIKTPIEDPSVISTKTASGSFNTSNQIEFGSVAIPKTLEFKSGKVEVYMDFAKCFSAFLISLIQIDSHSSSMKEMVESIELQKVVLDIRPGATYKLGEKTLNIGKNSYVELTNVKVDNDLNYRGQFAINANFLPDCNWIGEKLDCEFEGGKALLVLDAVKSKGVLTLKLPKEASKDRSVTLESCLLKFGKDKRSSTKSQKGVLELIKFQWQSGKGNHPTMQMNSDFDLHNTDAIIKTAIHQTKAHFPKEVPGSLVVDIGKGEKRSMHFATTGPARADKADVLIKKKNSTVNLKLANVDISKATYDKTGTMQFNLQGSKANIKELTWNGAGKDFTLKCGTGSILSVPNEFLVEKQKQASSTKVEMPMKLSLGSAVLKSGSHSMNLANLKGAMTLDVGEDVKINGSLGFGLPDLHLLTNYNAQVKANGIKIAIASGKSKFSIQDCSLTIPDKALETTLKEKVPSEFHIPLNKKVQEEKKWRYKNAYVKEVNIKDFAIHKMKTADNELVKFTASGKATSFGTVDKSGIILSRKRWNTKPWSMSGILKGEGEVKYKFVNQTDKQKAHLNYNLSLKVKMPEDVDLDWSKVSGGMIKLIEKKAIIKKLRTIEIPIKKKGEIKLFKKDSPFGKDFVISKLKVIDGDDSTKLSFHVETKL